MRTNRMNSVECLRVLVMLMIVIHHCVVSGLHLNDNLNGEIYCYNATNGLLSFINCYVIVAVNVFFLISGYFTIKFKLNKFLKLLGMIIFYSSIIYIIFAGIGVVEISVKNIIKYSVLAFNEYWFMTVYLILMLIAPYLNIVIDALKMDKRKYTGFLIVLFIITCIYGFAFDKDVVNVNSGYSLIYAIFLYFTGNYMKTYANLDQLKNIKHLILYVILGGINFILVFSLIYLEKGNIAWKLFAYNNPIIYFQSILLFAFFIKLNCNGRIGRSVAYLGGYTLGIYLIHSHELLIPYRFKGLEIMLNNIGVIFWPILIVLYCGILYIICNCLEMFRKEVTKYMIKVGKQILGR